MAANPERRAAICDAALELLGREGARAVTHRAVDREAGLPTGTCSNYFPSRPALFVGMGERIFTVLAPDPRRLERLQELPAAQAGPEYVAYVAERLLEQPVIARAWIELRLEAARSAGLTERLAPVIRDGFTTDVAFSKERGIPGDAATVRLLHHLINGIVLDALTIPLDPTVRPIAEVKAAAISVIRESDPS